MYLICRRAGFISSLIVVGLLLINLTAPVKAENVVDYTHRTLSIWTKSTQTGTKITPDKTGINNGVVGVNTSVEVFVGKFDKP